MIQFDAWAPSTRGTLCSQQRSFLSFLESYNFTEFPVHPDTLVFYASFLVMTGRIKSAGSIRQYLSAASTLHKMYGLTCATPSTYGPLHNMVKGIERGYSSPPKHRLPISKEILTNLIFHLNSIIYSTASWASRMTALSIKAVYLVLFYSMLRAGNTLPHSAKEFNPLRHLSWGRVSHHAEGVILSVSLSKTIQFQERVHQIPLARCENLHLCPVSALEDLVAARGPNLCGPADPVFAFPQDGSWAPLPKQTVVRHFNGQLAAMGLDPKDYSLHSFRHGGISFALLADNPVAWIRLNSDHKSECIFGYLNLEAERRFIVTKKMATMMAT